MPENQGTAIQTAFYFGVDRALLDGLRAGVAGQVTLRGFRTLAGMMIAANSDAPRLLVVETAALPQGREARHLVERLAQDTGVKPQLVCLAAGMSADQLADLGRQARVIFQPPFDTALIANALVALIGIPTPAERRVLIVGDSPLHDEANATALRRAGIRVQLVVEESRVMEMVERFRPELALVDLDMPLGSGRDLSTAIRDCPGCQALPIVFLSSDLTDGHGAGPRRIGGDDYLLKPVSGEALLATVQARLTPTGGSRRIRGLAGPVTASLTDPTRPVLLNRVHFLQRLDKEVAEHRTTGEGQAILYIQADPLSKLRQGEGDESLDERRHRIADLVIAQTSPGDRAAWLNDDALALWVNRADLGAVEAVAERIVRHLGANDPGSGLGVAAGSVSVGVGSFLPPVDNAQTLISRAQAAWVDASAAGGDRVSVYRCMVHGASLGRDLTQAQALDPTEAVLLPLLRQALAGEGFQLVYQPILPLRKATHHRYEVLLRLRTTQGAIIPPLAFLPVAERHGLLPALDRWVLSGALSVLRGERDAGRPTRFLIHQTPASLASPDWLAWVREEILRLDLIRQRPVFEFTAQSLLGNENQARLLFPELGKIGIEVCLTGVTDQEDILGLIARRPISCVKLALDLVAGSSAKRLKTVVDGNHRRGARVIASGIEDPETIGRVWSSGVDYIQGNFIQFPEEALSFNFEESVIG